MNMRQHSESLLHSESIDLYTRTYTLVHSHLCVRAHIHEQHASTCTITDRHTNMHACTQSLTLIYTIVCLVFVYVCVCVCIRSVCVCICVRTCDCIVL